MRYPNFCASSYTLQSKNAANDRTVNLYLEVIESGTGKDGAGAYMIRRPGFETLVQLPASPVRAVYSGDGLRVFAVAGAMVFEIIARTPTVIKLGRDELRLLMIRASGGTPAPVYLTTQTADQWAGNYTTVTGDPRPPVPTSYGFNDVAPGKTPPDGTVYPRHQAVTIDEWLDLFLATNSYHVLGTIPGVDGAATSRAQLIANGGQLVVMAGSSIYVHNGKELSGPHRAGFQIVDIDGFTIALDPGLHDFAVSALGDATTWNPLAFGSKQGEPDQIVSILNDHRELWLFGSQSAEVWVNAGLPIQPFQRQYGGFVEQGCAAAWTPARLDNTVFWLGTDERGNAVVWRAYGYQPLRVSHHGVERIWQKYPRVFDAEGFPIQINGHAFYVLHFPSANPNPTPGGPALGATWVYDCAASERLKFPQWFEWSEWDAIRGAWEMWRPRCHAFARGTHYAGDWLSGRVYGIDPDLNQDDRAPLRWLRSAPHISAEMRRQFFGALLIDFEMGDGLNDDVPVIETQTEPEAAIGINDNIAQLNANVAAGPEPAVLGQAGKNPQISVRISRDGGRTFGPERLISVGSQGKYKGRARITRTGEERDRVIEISGSDPAFSAIVGASFDQVVMGTG